MTPVNFKKNIISITATGLMIACTLVTAACSGATTGANSSSLSTTSVTKSNSQSSTQTTGTTQAATTSDNVNGNHVTSNESKNNSQTGSDRTFRGFQGQLSMGTIVSYDGSTLVLKTSNGETSNINCNNDTQIQKTVSLSLSDLKTGDQITVAGIKADDSSITASSIQSGNVLESRENADGQIPGGGRGEMGSILPSNRPNTSLTPPASFPAQNIPSMASGTISNIGSDSLAIQTKDNQNITIKVTSSTKIQKKRQWQQQRSIQRKHCVRATGFSQ